MEYDTLNKEELQKLTKENYVFKCRDGNIAIGKSDFLKLKSIDWLIGNIRTKKCFYECSRYLKIQYYYNTQ